MAVVNRDSACNGTWHAWKTVSYARRITATDSDRSLSVPQRDIPVCKTQDDLAARKFCMLGIAPAASNALGHGAELRGECGRFISVFVSDELTQSRLAVMGVREAGKSRPWY